MSGRRYPQVSPHFREVFVEFVAEIGEAGTRFRLQLICQILG